MQAEATKCRRLLRRHEKRQAVQGRTGDTRCRLSSTNCLTAGPIFLTKFVMPARTAKRARFSGILNSSWCSSTVSQAGRPVPCGQGMVRERHIDQNTSMRTMPRVGGARGCSMLCAQF